MKYKLTFKLFDTEQDAKAFCDEENLRGTLYKRKKHIAKYTQWSSKGRTESAFVAWYVV